MTASDDDRPTAVLVHRNVPFRETAERTLELDVYLARAGAESDGDERPSSSVDTDADPASSADAEANADRPIVVFVYGGGWTDGATGQFARYALAFAAAGWVAVECQYRLADDARFPAQIVDVHAALDWVGDHADEYGGDPDRLAVVGHSAGAQLAALASLTRDDPELTPGSSSRPDDPRSVAAVAGISGVYDFDHSADSRADFADLLGDRDADRSIEAQRRLASPAAQVSADEAIPPTLLLHGDEDAVVPAAQSERYRDALEASGATVEYDVIADADHVFLHSSGDYPATRDRVLAFLEAHV